ncbi:MAG: DUF5615 family PIN-like protein [Bauldia sp.]|nr:DUF5615 family PIN-like protein [Bauldia sp.]
MRFLVDAQLPPSFASWLNGQGHQARHVTEVGLGSSADQEIWDEASRSDAIIVSKDEDFADLVRRTASGPAVLWVRLGNTTTAALLGAIAPVFSDIVGAFERGERLVEFAD